MAEFCAVLPHKRSLLYALAVCLKYNAPIFHGIVAQDRFINICKFHAYMREIYRTIL